MRKANGLPVILAVALANLAKSLSMSDVSGPAAGGVRV
jgi:hypothetical protein